MDDQRPDATDLEADLDPAAETAVPMESRRLPPADAAPRAGDGGLSRRAAEAGLGGDAPGAGGGREGGLQEHGIQGPGYPTEDMDDVAAGPGEEDEDDLDDDDEDEDDDELEEEDEDGYRLGGDPEVDAMLPGGAAELLPPGGDRLGGDRDTDPNLNGGHGIRMTAPEEGPIPIELEPTDTSIIGHGHEDKAAWNRERVAQLQAMEDDERPVRPATSEALGIGGAAVAGALAGWEDGTLARTVAQGEDGFDGELSEEGEVLGDAGFADLGDVMADGSIADPNNMPRLPEHRNFESGYDDDIPPEERLLAVDGEDPLSAGAEFGVAEELEMEGLNDTDSISRVFEDTRDRLSDSMDGNELRRARNDDDGR